MNCINTCLFTVIMALPFYGWAQTSSCPDLKTGDDVLSYIIQNHPEINYLDKVEDQTKKKIEIAGQRPNPEVDVEHVREKDFGQSVSVTESTIKHVFELGKKRRSRIDVAKSELKLFEGRYRGSKENLVVQTVLGLYQLKQLTHLTHTYDEAIGTFNKIIRQYKKRKILNPKEEISLITFELASNDYQLKKAKVNNSMNKVKAFFRMALGNICDLPNKLLIPDVKDLLESKTFTEVAYSDKFSQIQKSKYLLDLANSKYQLERSKAYPNFKAGPFIGNKSQQSNNNLLAGVSVTFDLPVLNRNAGGKSEALSQITAATQKYENTKIQTRIDKNLWLKIYQDAKNNITKAISHNLIEKKHKKVERLFKRGIISASLVIETHRQLIEFTSTLQNQELVALEALWNIYAIEGSILEEKLLLGSIK